MLGTTARSPTGTRNDDDTKSLSPHAILSVYFFSLLHQLYLFYEDIGKPIYESCHLIQTSPFN